LCLSVGSCEKQGEKGSLNFFKISLARAAGSPYIARPLTRKRICEGPKASKQRKRWQSGSG
jgi:hypothetical protein